MNKFLLILKTLASAVCLFAAYVGYNFWSIWQQNNQAELSTLSISQKEVSLGDTFTLDASFKVPWHREMNIEQLVKLPEGLRLMPDTLKAQRQKLNFNGYRRWNCTLTAIALEDGTYTDKKVEFRLVSDRNGEQNQLACSLPELHVKAPEIIDNKIVSRSENIDDSVLSKATSVNNADTLSESSGNLTLYIALLLLSMLIIYLLFKPGKGLPPWEEAFKKLSQLANHPPENFEKFFLTLTDILKVYTARRFSFNATACSSQEFVKKLARKNKLPKDQIIQLESMLKNADSIKFGGEVGNQKLISESIAKVHNFITTTKPTEEESK